MFPTAELIRASIKGLIAKVESEKIEGRARVLAEFAVTENFSKGFGGIQLNHVAKYSGKIKWIKHETTRGKLLRQIKTFMRDFENN